MNLLNWRDQIYSFRVASGPIFFFRTRVALFTGTVAVVVAYLATDALGIAALAAGLGTGAFTTLAAFSAFFGTPPGK